MAQFTTPPVIDGFETTLAQSWNGLVGTIYVDAIPNATLSGGDKTYVVVNPGKTTQQVARISGWSAGQLTCDSVAVKKGAGTNYTSNTHSVKSKVIITDVYQTWEDVETAVNSKADTNNPTFTTMITGPVYASLSALTTAYPTPTNGQQSVFCTLEGQYYDAQGGSRQPRANGVNPNASTTVAGKVEEATLAQQGSQTATGGTGARLFINPVNTAKTSSGSSDENKIPLLGSTGKLPVGFLDIDIPNVIGGDGSDGAYTITTNQSLAISAYTNSFGYLEKNYSSVSIGASAILTFTNAQTAGNLIYIKCKGDCTISGSINGAGLGGIGGNGTASGSSTAGVSGTRGKFINAPTFTDFSNLGTGGNRAGVVGTGGAAVVQSYIDIFNRNVFAGAGGGGGGGGGDNPGGSGGTGGTGGGVMILEVGGKLIFTGSINFSGTNGTNGSGSGSTGGCAGGGGGGGGSVVLFVNTITTNTGSILVNGGNGGSGSNSSGFTTGAGGGGGGGLSGGGNGGIGANSGVAGTTNTYGSGGAGGTSGTNIGGGGGGGGAGYKKIISYD